MTNDTFASCELAAQTQLDAYNAHDIEAFAAVYTDDVKLLDLSTGRLFCNGIEELKALYGKKFAERPTLHCHLIKRIVCPPFVIDEEDATGLGEGRNIHAVATYECRDGKICRAWFLREISE